VQNPARDFDRLAALAGREKSSTSSIGSPCGGGVGEKEVVADSAKSASLRSEVSSLKVPET
jgi:hypothetical protein